MLIIGKSVSSEVKLISLEIIINVKQLLASAEMDPWKCRVAGCSNERMPWYHLCKQHRFDLRVELLEEEFHGVKGLTAYKEERLYLKADIKDMAEKIKYLKASLKEKEKEKSQLTFRLKKKKAKILRLKASIKKKESDRLFKSIPSYARSARDIPLTY